MYQATTRNRASSLKNFIGHWNIDLGTERAEPADAYVGGASPPCKRRARRKLAARSDFHKIRVKRHERGKMAKPDVKDVARNIRVTRIRALCTRLLSLGPERSQEVSLAKESQAQRAHLTVVEAPQPLPDKQASVSIVAQYPPLTNGSAKLASALVHMFQATGHSVATITGPGLSIARHQINFANENKYLKTASAAASDEREALAIVMARALEFARVSGNTWRQRRLEELRRFRFLARTIRRAKRTALVLDRNPFGSRDQLGFLLVACLLSLVTFRPVALFWRRHTALDIFHSLVGHDVPLPAPGVAEDAAYSAAFSGRTTEPRFRLTALRAEQTARFLAEREASERASSILQDVQFLAALANRHDLRKLLSLRVLGPPTVMSGAASDAALPPLGAANVRVRLPAAPDLAVTRYMLHLRSVLGLEQRFPLDAREDIRRFISWYVTEAATDVPGRWVPIAEGIRGRFRKAEVLALNPERAKNLTSLIARDANPVPLSPQLADIYSANDKARERYDLTDAVDRIAFAVEHLLRLEEGADAKEFSGAALHRFLAAPVGQDGQNVSRLTFLLALQLRLEVTGQDAVEEPWAAESLRVWGESIVLDRLPHLSGLISRPNAPVKNMRVAVAGLPGSSTGVGSNLHMSRMALRKLGFEADVQDLAGGRLATRSSKSEGRRPMRPFALHHVNADRIPQSVLTPEFLRQPETAHVGFLLWEFGVLPESHRLALDVLDEIWVPTAFLKETYSRATETPVRNVLKGIHVPQVRATDLSRFGISREDTVFLTCFDFHSALARKNPLAAVEAFLDAFPNDPSKRLIVKSTPPVANHWGDPENQWAKIEALAARDARIVILTDLMPFRELISLVRAADCLVSPHRAEGFGLLPAYALSQATPVIATDYSGTTDFCTPETAIAVGYDLAPLADNYAGQPMEGAVWAEIDKSQLSKEMAAFADDPVDARVRAVRGRRLISSRYSPARQAARYRDRLTDLGVLPQEAMPSRRASR